VTYGTNLESEYLLRPKSIAPDNVVNWYDYGSLGPATDHADNEHDKFVINYVKEASDAHYLAMFFDAPGSGTAGKHRCDYCESGLDAATFVVKDDPGDFNHLNRWSFNWVAAWADGLVYGVTGRSKFRPV
jgi:hypothetical protein